MKKLTILILLIIAGTITSTHATDSDNPADVRSTLNEVWLDILTINKESNKKLRIQQILRKHKRRITSLLIRRMHRTPNPNQALQAPKNNGHKPTSRTLKSPSLKSLQKKLSKNKNNNLQRLPSSSHKPLTNELRREFNQTLNQTTTTLEALKIPDTTNLTEAEEKEAILKLVEGGLGKELINGLLDIVYRSYKRHLRQARKNGTEPLNNKELNYKPTKQKSSEKRWNR
jgi:hypothetical protein